LAFALAIGNKDTKSFAKLLDLAPDAKSTKVIEMITKDRATQDFLRTYNGKAEDNTEVHKMAAKKNGKGRYNPPTSGQEPRRYQKSYQQQQQHHRNTTSSEEGEEKCCWCGHDKHQKEQCPARNAICMKCRKRGHYARVCMARKDSYRQVKDLNTESTTYDLPSTAFGNLVATKIGTTESTKEKCLKAMRPIWISGEDQEEQLHELQCEVDSGAGDNAMPWQIYKDVFGRKPLDKATMTITGYGGHKVSNLGSSMMRIHLKDRMMNIRFQITETTGPTALGLQSARLLGYVSFPKVEKPTKKIEDKEIKVHAAVHSIKSALEEQPRRPKEVQKPKQELLEHHRRFRKTQEDPEKRARKPTWKPTGAQYQRNKRFLRQSVAGATEAGASTQSVAEATRAAGAASRATGVAGAEVGATPPSRSGTIPEAMWQEPQWQMPQRQEPHPHHPGWQEPNLQ
jgi:hypothetical protein